MLVGAETGVVRPEAVEAVAITSYVVPGARPVRLQSYGTGQVSMIGCPPPIEVAARVYGPVIPGGGEIKANASDGPSTVSSIEGASAAGVASVTDGAGGVGSPEVVSVPVNVTV